MLNCALNAFFPPIMSGYSRDAGVVLPRLPGHSSGGAIAAKLSPFTKLRTRVAVTLSPLTAAQYLH